MTTVLAPVIRNDDDLASAIARVETLWGAEAETEDGDELDVWMTLVQEYERKHHAMTPPSPIEAVAGLMDRLQLARADLLPIFGSYGRLSEFLSGKRSLSKAHIKALHCTYGVPYEALMG